MLPVPSISICSPFEKLEYAVNNLDSNGVFTPDQVSYYIRGQEFFRLLDKCLKDGSVVVESRFPLKYKLTNVRPINLKQTPATESKPAKKKPQKTPQPTSKPLKKTKHNQAILEVVENYKSKGLPFTNKDIIQACGINERQLLDSSCYKAVQQIREELIESDQRTRLRNALDELKQKGAYIPLAAIANHAKSGYSKINDFPDLQKELNEYNNQFDITYQRKQAIQKALKVIEETREICSLFRLAELAGVERRVLDNRTYREFKREFRELQQQIKAEKATKIRVVYQFK